MFKITEEEGRRALEVVRDRLKSGEITDAQFDMDHILRRSAEGCGTAGCIAGHAARALIPDCWMPHRLRDPNAPDVDEAVLALERTVPCAAALFYDYNSQREVSRHSAIEAIDRALAGDDDPWGTRR